MLKMSQRLFCAFIVCSVLTGCSSVSKPNDKEIQETEAASKKKTGGPVVLGEKSEGSTILVITNKTGHTISQFAYAPASQKDPQWKTMMNGNQRIEPNAEFKWNAPTNTGEPLNIQITLGDGSEVILHKVDPFALSDVSDLTIHMKSIVPYITYTDNQGKEIDTYKAEAAASNAAKKASKDDKKKDDEKEKDKDQDKEQDQEESKEENNASAPEAGSTPSQPSYEPNIPDYNEPEYNEPAYTPPAYTPPAYDPGIQDPVITEPDPAPVTPAPAPAPAPAPQEPSYDDPIFDEPTYEPPTISSGGADNCLDGPGQ